MPHDHQVFVQFSDVLGDVPHVIHGREAVPLKRETPCAKALGQDLRGLFRSGLTAVVHRPYTDARFLEERGGAFHIVPTPVRERTIRVLLLGHGDTVLHQVDTHDPVPPFM
jgi:hypothetical protein